MRRRRRSTRAARGTTTTGCWPTPTSMPLPSRLGCPLTTSRPWRRCGPASTPSPSGRWAAPPQRPSRWPRSPGSRESRPRSACRRSANPAIIHLRNLVDDRYVGQGDGLSCAADARGRAVAGLGTDVAAGRRARGQYPDHRLRTHHRRTVQRGWRVRGRGHRRQHPGSPPGTRRTPGRTCR